ncbi:hypothetical protein PFISCL1PPCAC_5852, partial [Pristionchus fissidentatus]
MSTYSLEWYYGNTVAHNLPLPLQRNFDVVAFYCLPPGSFVRHNLCCFVVKTMKLRDRGQSMHEPSNDDDVI